MKITGKTSVTTTVLRLFYMKYWVWGVHLLNNINTTTTQTYTTDINATVYTVCVFQGVFEGVCVWVSLDNLMHCLNNTISKKAYDWIMGCDLIALGQFHTKVNLTMKKENFYQRAFDGLNSHVSSLLKFLKNYLNGHDSYSS